MTPAIPAVVPAAPCQACGWPLSSPVWRFGIPGPRSRPIDTPNDSDRLDGWKEISGYLKRSIRTVQRWEALSGLPVRRIGANGGDVVFAFRHEIDNWLRQEVAAGRVSDDTTLDPPTPPEPGMADVPPPPPQRLPGRSGWTRARMGWSLAAVALLALGSWAAFAWVTARSAPQPARWAAADGRIRILALDGREICGIPFDVPFVLADYLDLPPGQRVASDLRTAPWPNTLRKIDIADLDGDGRREIVVVVKPQDRNRDELRVYDSRCRALWRWSDAPSVTFGETTYAPPYWMMWVAITEEPGGGRAIWVSRRHTKYFASVLVKLDARGNRVGEFWHAGEITALHTGRLGGSPVVAIGGVNNERRLPFVAVFDGQRFGGAGPAETPEYQFRAPGEQPPGQPAIYVIFPDSRLGTLGPGMRSVQTLIVHPEWVSVEIPQYAVDTPDAHVFGSVSFDLDATGRPLHVELSDPYRTAYALTLQRGLLKQPFDPREGVDLQQRVLVWDGGRFRVAAASSGASH